MISKEEIRKLSQMARIEINEDDLANIKNNLSRILDLVSKLKEANVSRADEISSDFVAHNVARDDKSPHKAGEHSEQLLEQVSDIEGGFVKVNKVL